MALTLDELKRLLEKEGLKYFVDPNKPMVMLGVQGLHGTYQFVIHLDVEGRFLQFRTIRYLQCPAGLSNLSAVLRVLADLNYQLRFVKFGWDSSDGEIVVYGDTWLMDAKLTQEQFSRMLGNYLPTIDTNYPRIKQTIETGRDPGPPTPDDVVKSAPEGGGLRDRLRKLLGGHKVKEPEIDEI